jgi:hypothetical protein
MHKKYVVGENFALRGYYAAGNGDSLPTFRDNVSFQSSRVKYQSRVKNNSNIIRGGRLKSQIRGDLQAQLELRVGH